MSEANPKGYYASLGLEPWATADEIRAAFHRCAKQYHPDLNPSPQAKARFQAVSEAYQTLSNPSRRAAYDNSRWAGAPDKTDLGPVRWRRSKLDVRSLAPSNSGLVQFVGFGALGLAFLALLVLVDAVPRGSELIPAISSPEIAASASRPAPDAERSPLEFVSLPLQIPSAPTAASGPQPNPAPSTALLPSRPVPTQNDPLSGAWLLRNLSNPKPMLNLLDQEEAARIQEQLIELGYLIGPADGVWGPRTHAAHEDFRRVQGLGSDEGRIKETQIAVVEEPQPGTGSLATAETRGPVEEEAVLPPGPSTELTGLGNKPTNDLPPGEVRDAAPEPQLAVPLRQAGAEATYVGVWARSRADCFLKTYAPPLAISAQRAESFGGHMGSCEFAQVQQEGAGWRTRARCSAHGKSWTANVQLRVTGSTLSWSSERGQVTYYRCPRR